MKLVQTSHLLQLASLYDELLPLQLYINLDAVLIIHVMILCFRLAQGWLKVKRLDTQADPLKQIKVSILPWSLSQNEKIGMYYQYDVIRVKVFNLAS